MRRWHVAMVAGLAVAGTAGAAGWATIHDRPATPPVRAIATATAPVVRTTIAERRTVDGTLGYSGTDVVIAAGPGVVNWLPAVGRVIGRGQIAYETDGAGVRLMYGSRSAWRPFGVGMTDGADVRQLETNLRALGYGAGLTVDRHFSAATYRAVRRWQRAAHLAVTGTVPLGQIVFARGAVRVAGRDLDIGAQVQPGMKVMHGTGEAQAITVQLSPTDLPNVRAGDPVVVTLPDGATRTGRISAIGAVAVPPADAADSGGGDNPDGGAAPQSTAPVTITVRKRIRGLLDQTEVRVSITSAEHRRVLAVPTTALHARPGGAYDVIVVPGGRHVPVQADLFDELTGLVEVSGPGLAEGLRVEVPSDGA